MKRFLRLAALLCMAAVISLPAVAPVFATAPKPQPTAATLATGQYLTNIAVAGVGAPERLLHSITLGAQMAQQAVPQAEERPEDQTGWTGLLAVDFPLAQADTVTKELVLRLNQRILEENYPAKIAPLGTTLTDNPKHLTNYGQGGLLDCFTVDTILYNKNNQLEPGTALHGRQEYYGYNLQTEGIARQDVWHAAAEATKKEPWQCTWWVWGRAAQYLDLAYDADFKALCDGEDNFGHGRSYYARLRPFFLSDKTPSANSLVSWTAGTYGHVAYVEAVDADGIWVTMTDSGHTWRGVTYIPKGDDPNNPYPLYWYPTETFNGFNHLDYRPDGTPMGEYAAQLAFSTP